MTRLAATILVLVLLSSVPAAAQSRGTNDFEVQRFRVPGRTHGDLTGFRIHTDNSYMSLTLLGFLRFVGIGFADLSRLSINGVQVYCLDCSIGATCTPNGTGAFAKRIANAWVCN